MRDFSIHIKSPDNSNIYVNGSFIGLIDNTEVFSLDLKTYTNSLVITKEPISTNKKLVLPYTVKLSFSKDGVFCESDMVKVVPFENGHYDIILEKSAVKHTKTLNIVFDDFVDVYNVVVVNDGSTYINIYKMNVLKYSTQIDEIENVICQKNNNYITIKGSTQNGNYHVIVLDEDNDFNEVVNCQAYKLEEDSQSLKILSKVNDIAKHGKVEVINFEDKNLNSEYFVYLKNEAVICKSKHLVPYAFLEAIKLNNFPLAKKYLSENLNKTASSEHLKQYFNNLQKIYYNTYSDNENLVNYTTLQNNQYKSYNFTLINNKIDEIEEANI